MKCAGLPLQSPAPSDRKEYIHHKQMGRLRERKDARPSLGINHTQYKMAVCTARRLPVVLFCQELAIACHLLA